MSLRARLLVAMLLLVTAGLLAADLATYRFLGSFLTRRVDQQLVVARQVAVQVLSAPSFERGPGPPEGGSSILFPAGTYCALVDQGGSVARSHVFGLGLGDITPSPPLLPTGLPGSSSATTAAVTARFTAPGGSGSASYRVEADAVVGGGTLVVAIPLNDVSATLHRLLLIEGAVTFGVLLALGGLAWWLVRLGFRPLVRMEETAAAIAAGDLSRRVDTADPRTEIGRLGQALNTMLAKIELAFTERRASEERLRRFVADASHELRTPLTSVRGYAELFRRGAVEDDAGLERAMKRIEEESGRMGELVDELALLARLDQGRPLEREPVDLAEIASAAVDAAAVADPGREITLDALEPLLVLGDPLRLRQVADNLVTNAREHTPAGTSVRVRVRPEGSDGLLEVEDQGPGISPEHADRIFERFYRADASRSRESGGAGLGLSIVAAVAEAHGGSVAYVAPNGGGARFVVRIPRAEASARSNDVPSPA